MIDKSEDSKFLIKQTRDHKVYEVSVVDLGGGKAELQGLPPQLSAFLFNFTDRELIEDTLDVLNVLITMYDSKGNGQVNIVNQLPSSL